MLVSTYNNISWEVVSGGTCRGGVFSWEGGGSVKFGVKKFSTCPHSPELLRWSYLPGGSRVDPCVQKGWIMYVVALCGGMYDVVY